MPALKVNENNGATVIGMPRQKPYTQILNDVLIKLYSPGFHLPGEQRAVFDFILRQTHGFQKKADKISLSQFSEALGLKKPSVIRSIKALLAKKLIAVSEIANESIKVYEINENTDEWLSLAEWLTLAKPLKVVSNIAKKPLAKLLPTKETIKETITKEIKNSSCPGFENPDEETKNQSPEKPLKKAKKYIFQEAHVELAKLLASSIQENKPDFKLPASLDEWSDTARLMCERDKRSIQDIADVIVWCQKDQFWKNNILSMSSVRKQFDRLQMKARERPKQGVFQTIHDRNRQACEDFIRGEW